MFIDENGKKWYKVGLHIHTTISDGKVTPERMARIYKNAGYDAVAMTDHWNYHDFDKIEDLEIISGCEYNLGSSNTIHDVMHIVGFGMKKDPKIERNAAPQAVIDAINGVDGFAVLAHPHWSLNDKSDILPLKGFAAVEIYNAVSEAVMSNRAYSGYIIDSLANDGMYLPIIATDDAHYYNGHDNTRGFVMVAAKSGSAEDILAALKAGDFYASQGPHLEVCREGDKIIARCSPCVTIAFMSNSAWAPDRMVRGDSVTCAEYTVKDFEKWLRVEVCDRAGNFAWSNIIEL